MQRTLMIKLFLMACLCMMFLVGLGMIKGLVNERQFYKQAVVDEIKQTQVSNQTITTPFIVQDGKTIMPIIPSDSQIDGSLLVSDGKYSRSIYQIISYDGKFHVKQSYRMADFLQDNQSGTTPNQAKPSDEQSTAYQEPPAKEMVDTTQSSITIVPSYRLLIPISDLRGVNLPFVMVNNQKISTVFVQSQTGDYLQADLGHLKDVKELNISFDFEIAGLDEVAFAPLGDNSVFRVSADWADVKFYGDALPSQKTLTKNDFSAVWQNPYLAQQNNAILLSNMTCIQDCRNTDYRTAQTQFIDVSNIYTQTDRTIKYALILLVVSFGTFFLFEIIKNLRIHPIQYALVAAALLSFYTLLLSLAEHIVFWQAYLVASVACVGLIGWYACYMLASLGRGALFSLILGGLYAGFYVILSASEFNLLLGSVFCFALIFVVMFITRHIDWYAIGYSNNDKDDKNNPPKTHHKPSVINQDTQENPQPIANQDKNAASSTGETL